MKEILETKEKITHERAEMKDMCAINVHKMDICNMAVLYALPTYEIYIRSDLLRTDGQRQIPGIIVDNTEVTIRINRIHLQC